MRLQRNFLSVLANSLLKNGKKSKAEGICFDFLYKLRLETKQNPVIVLNAAINKIKPIVTLKGKRVAGTNLKIPALVVSGRDISVAIKWLIDAAIIRGGDQKISDKLVQEVLDILANRGSSLKKKNELHKLALVNRPFLKFM
jgi:small subunit ribosomal protein S7